MQARPVGLHACPAKQIAPHQHTRHQHLLYQRRRFLRNTQSAIYRRRTHPLCRAGHLNAIVKLDLASLSRYAVVSTHRERRVSLQSDKKKDNEAPSCTSTLVLYHMLSPYRYHCCCCCLVVDAR